MVKSTDTKNNISVVMVSNTMNHHQFPFCDSMYKEDGITFTFVATKPMTKERLAMGFSDLNNSREYIVRAYESDDQKQKAIEIINSSDFVIYGSAPFEYIRRRIRDGNKWTFIYSERLFKETRAKDFLNIKTICACLLRYFFVSHKRLRLLCASAFTSSDFGFFRFKEKHAFKWGYFPPISEFAFSYLLQKKQSLSIVWVGRMIHWKHPELVVELAKRLTDNDFKFNITVVGDGVMLEQTKALADTYDVADKISFLGALSADKTREEMEKSSILITTSDHNEGWGAIVNEGMSSGCAVVGSSLMGSVPYLIKDKENGLVFESGNADDLYEKVKTLLTDDNLREKISENAYYSIVNKYNGKVAAQKLANVMKEYLDGNENFSFDDGICSIAKRMKNNWYKG